jgi:anti-sigma-K factor RskA
MNYLQSERLDALARAHALGTLSPRAARRFARVVASSAVAARAVTEWQQLLGALERGAPGSPPPRPQVWADVQRRLFGRDLPVPGSVGAARGGAGSAAGWLRWPIGLVAGAALLWATLALRPQMFGMEPLSAAAPASYVGVLQDSQGRALLATAARRHGLVLTVRPLRPLAPAPGQALTIWAWNDTDATPRRIGAWTTGQTAEIALPGQAEALLGSMTHLGLSSEPVSAAPAAPTRPFIAEGPCAKVW